VTLIQKNFLETTSLFFFPQDQKVSWHATPFEERLEKALSEEKLLSERFLDFL